MPEWPRKVTEQKAEAGAIISYEGLDWIDISPKGIPAPLIDTEKGPVWGRFEAKDLTKMEYVADVDDSEEEILKEMGRIDFEPRTGKHAYEHSKRKDGEDAYELIQKDGTWLLSANTPKTIRHIIAKTLEHEAAINPRINECTAHISLRLIRPEHTEYWANEAGEAHFDGTDDINYVVTSAPGTVQYLPDSPVAVIDPDVQKNNFTQPAEKWFREKGAPDGLAASSMLPMKLYRFDDSTLHSIPWDMPAVSAENSGKPRFFFRITFSPEAPWKGK